LNLVVVSSAANVDLYRLQGVVKKVAHTHTILLAVFLAVPRNWKRTFADTFSYPMRT